MAPLRTGIRSTARACLMAVVKRAARVYVAGDTLEDALAVSAGLARKGFLSTLAYWDATHHSADEVAGRYRASLEALAADPATGYLSIKLPSLRYSAELLAELAARARRIGARLHFDSLAHDTAERTRSTVERLLAGAACPSLGYTLPARWRRSLDDAEWAAERGLMVRVVKGQWLDPGDPYRDRREAYLQVIDVLAGRCAHVGVASHDLPLAAEALSRLQAAGTPCELELLYGVPALASVKLAARMGVPVRFYVPYGEAYVPYALSRMRENPRMALWLLKDLAGVGAREPGP